jgi:photosystem II stability/assembly factor-like uncharacterized protein
VVDPLRPTESGTPSTANRSAQKKEGKVLKRSFCIIAFSALLLGECTMDAPFLTPATKQTTQMATATLSPAFTAPLPMIAATQTLFTTPISTDTPLVPSTFLPTGTPLALLKSGQIIDLTSLQMTDEKNGWAIASTGHIVHTEDAGYTWQDVTPPTEVYQSYSEAGFFALDANIAWATPGEFVNCYMSKCNKESIATGLIWRTTDGGKAWQPGGPIPSSIDPEGAAVSVQNYLPIRMQFIDSQIGWLMIDGTIRTEDYKRKTSGTILFRTRDGGENWELMNSHYRDFNFPPGYSPDVPAIRGFAFIDSQTGWVVGQSDLSGMREVPVEDVISNGALILKKTVDGGRSFIDGPLLFPVDLDQPEYQGLTMSCGVHQILPIAPNSITLEWTCAIQPVQISYYLFSVSDDGGQTWHHWHSRWNEFFLNRQEGWRQFCDGLCGLESSVDGGLTWTTIKKVNWEIWQLDFASSKAGWAIVFLNDSAGTKGLVHTSNGGETWAEIKPKVINK